MSQVIAASMPSVSQLPHLAPRQRVRRFSVDEYHDLIARNYFAGDEQYELLEGWIVAKMSRNPPHDVAVDKAHEAIRDRLPTGWRVRVQSAITLEHSEPEPDLAVVRGPAGRYIDAHPTVADIALLVEAAASSLDLDRVDKGRIYATAGIPVYLILNTNASQVELFIRPSGSAPTDPYGPPTIFSGDDLVPLMIAGQKVAEIPARDLLP